MLCQSDQTEILHFLNCFSTYVSSHLIFICIFQGQGHGSIIVLWIKSPPQNKKGVTFKHLK